MMYLAFALLTDNLIVVEPHTVKGRTEITLETADHIFIMELKFDKMVEEALAQINAIHYVDWEGLACEI